MDIRNLNITIVGLGIIGASLAEGLKKLQPQNVWGIDINKSTLKTAKEKGIIDEGYFDGNQCLEKSDLIIVALYPKMTLEFIKDNMDSFKKDALITDVSGIKENIINEIKKILRDDLEFIGGHPMAGKEDKGIHNSDSNIFLGANYIITPMSDNRKESIKFLSDLMKSVGFEKITTVSVKCHDRTVAYTSQLTHVLATSLMNLSNNYKSAESFIGGSFKDATRVAQINENLWSELLIDNKENIVNVIEEFQEEMNKIKEAIENKNENKLKKILREGKEFSKRRID